MRVLVTGAAGFIGFHLTQRLLNDGHEVWGIDNLNDYYDVRLKQARLERLLPQAAFHFQPLDVSDRAGVTQFFKTEQFDWVVNLAAQAGVRYSIDNPMAYVDSNLVGFANILEGCRHSQVSHFVFASSSSVYGATTKTPFELEDRVDHPISFYAATKRANELMAHSYSHLFQLPTTGLRFFTVYGPWGRPDMAAFKFVKAIENGEPIDVYNHGKMRRDFTYIDDVIEGVVRVLHYPPALGTATPSDAPYRLYNIGNTAPVELMDFIKAIESALGKPAKLNLMPMQPGEVLVTYADVSALVNDVGFCPSTSVEDGMKAFIDWYRDYYGLRRVKVDSESPVAH
ncbi:MAG: NAD-dependent epimerase [Cyanobacteria bacterium P01_F01_bin.33]